MNIPIKNIIKSIKVELSSDPSTVIFAKLWDGIRDEVIDNRFKIKSYYNFLEESNGARFGLIDLFSSEMLAKSQYRVTDMQGGEENWMCIGQILYEPLVINRIDGKVYRFYQGGETDIAPDCFGSFEDFLLEYVFGEKYIEIVPNFEPDEWYKLVIGQLQIFKEKL